MTKYYCCRVGKFSEDSHFDKTFNKPIVEKKYENIRWALNEASLSKTKVDSINREIKNGIKFYIVLFPNSPRNYPYAICELKFIKERNLGPLIDFDETNEERGWDERTIHGNDDFKYDFKFNEIYLLKTNSFNNIKIKGQSTFFELNVGKKNQDLLRQIEIEMKYIKKYVPPIKCLF